jgi:hypothetical protein
MREGDWMLVEYYDQEKAELYNLSSDPGESRDVAAGNPERVAQMRAALAAWRKSVSAQENRPNPNFDPGKYQELYIDVDASRFQPDQADQAQWEAMRRWRKAMDTVPKVNQRANPLALPR